MSSLRPGVLLTPIGSGGVAPLSPCGVTAAASAAMGTALARIQRLDLGGPRTSVCGSFAAAPAANAESGADDFEEERGTSSDGEGAAELPAPPPHESCWVSKTASC